MGYTQGAFSFYKSVFGTEFVWSINRMGDVAPDPSVPALSDAERNMIMHIELPILGGHILMATDMLESKGHELRIGNTVTINLEPDARAETDRLYEALSAGSSDGTGIQDMFWGSYWGTCLDRFGVRWMFNCTEPVK
jgi:PhnB protein